MYTLRFTEDAAKQYVLLLKKAPAAAKKVEKLLQELQEHLLSRLKIENFTPARVIK